MRCYVCKVDKLSKEFPQDNITDTCDHPPIHCLRCIIERVNEKTPYCPYDECEAKVADPGKVADDCKNELEHLYPPVVAPAELEELQQRGVSATEHRINIVMLTGDSVSLPFNPDMTVEDLKAEVKKTFEVEETKQQLMYSDQILEDYVDGNMRRLSDYNIKPFHTIHLMVLLYEIPQHFNHVVFDLFWGYPAACERDFLDASCLVFHGKTYRDVVDYRHYLFLNATATNKSIWHSGDVMDDANRIGHHTIEVCLKDLPASVTHLFFTLSAWKSPTIAHYPNPSLKFFEASDKSKDLCKTTFEDACHSQAVIMCSVQRRGGQWTIFECGKRSAGNAMNYERLISTIQSLISV